MDDLRERAIEKVIVMLTGTIKNSQTVTEHARDITDAILALVDAEYRPGGWVSVKERPPENGQRVCYYFKPVGIHAGWYERHGVHDVFFSGAGFLTDDVTYWMPLLEPPKEEP